MPRCLFFFLGLLFLSISGQAQLTGQLNTFHISSEKILPRRVDVWQSQMKSPVEQILIAHDGQMLFQGDSTWNKQEWGLDECLDSLINKGYLKNTLVIAIWNRNEARHRNYFPQKPFESLAKTFKDSVLALTRTNSKQLLFSGKPNSDDYLCFVLNEVWLQVKQRYELAELPIYMIGSSMGGLISMYAACEYPTRIKGVACLSTHWTGLWSNYRNPIPEAFLNYLENHRQEALKSRWYFDYGNVTLDSLYAPHQEKVNQLFTSWGLPQSQFKSRFFPGADHSEKAWRERLPGVLLYLMEPEDQ